MIRKLLIANRGEIAVRVIRAARQLGIKTVAVYSDADRDALHTKLADEAVHIGASESDQSYLDANRIVEVAKQAGADAIHPGYGFLSERAHFAELCESRDIVFVGPPASAMRLLGSKIEAKQLAVEAGVPVTPGYFEPGATVNELRAHAIEIGFPVMLKASAGGGGRGMRVVVRPEDFDQEFQIASDEALKGFGDGAMMVEKLILQPRHVEVQIMADQFGTVACLFERECSLQRRHQKVVEEAPSPIMSEKLWGQMRDASRALATRAGYIGAGTVEFMVDDSSENFYFLEVNARIQVEHPVTEEIAGIDLVAWQLRIAQGERLDLPAELVAGQRTRIQGHAIEARIVAEDPARGFLPSIGQVLAWAEPKGPGVRVETGYGPHSTISKYYDSLLAKVIAHGATRVEAIDRLTSALQDFHILGVKTNIGYVLDILANEDFRAGRIDTGFLGRVFSDWGSQALDPSVVAIAQAARISTPVTRETRDSDGAWSMLDDFRSTVG